MQTLSKLKQGAAACHRLCEKSENVTVVQVKPHWSSCISHWNITSRQQASTQRAMKSKPLLLCGRKPLSVRTKMLMWKRPNMNGGTYEEGWNVKKPRRESWHEPVLSQNFLLDEKHEYPKVSSQDGCSAWARVKILYLHYCAIYPPQVVLQRDTKRRSLLQVRLSAMLHRIFSRCCIPNKLDFALLEICFWTPEHIPYFFLAIFHISSRHRTGGDASIKNAKLQTQY